MSLYPVLYCSYIVISGTVLLPHRYKRYFTAPTSLYPVIYCCYIVTSGSVLHLITFSTVTSLHFMPVVLYIFCISLTYITVQNSSNFIFYSFNHSRNLANNKEGWGKSTLGVRNFNLRKSQVRKRGKICWNHPFPPLSPQFFLFVPLQRSSPPLQKNCYIEKYWAGGGSCPPCCPK
jgi:hypothetical protein